MNALVLNCGSSSIKYQLIKMPEEQILAKGKIEKLGIKGSFLEYSRNDSPPVVINQDIRKHSTGIKMILDMLVSKEHGVIGNFSEISGVGHRVVHGGEKLTGSVLVNKEIISVIEECSLLAPLHNPPNLAGIYGCAEIMPSVPQVAVFDTAIHSSIPPEAYIYAIPYEYYERLRVRRYSFHGIAFRYIVGRTKTVINDELSKYRISMLMLGSGNTICAYKHGKSIDASTGFTPLEGLVHSTRSGDMDPAIVTFLMDREKLSTKQINDILTKKSGWLGVSGLSMDMGEVIKEAEKGNKQCRLAIDVYCYRLKKYMGAYSAAMGGVDIITFSGGVGERGISIREQVLDGLEFLGVKLDKEKNKAGGKEGKISSPDSRVGIYVIPVNEEIVIARDTADVLK